MAKTRQTPRDRKLQNLRVAAAEIGATPAELFPGYGDPIPLDSNPCHQESAGLLTCNGTDQEVVPFPAGGPWRLVVTNGVITFENAGGAVQGGEPTTNLNEHSLGAAVAGKGDDDDPADNPPLPPPATE